jgi:outer membrane protein
MSRNRRLLLARMRALVGAVITAGLCPIAHAADDSTDQGESAFQLRIRAVYLQPTHRPVLDSADDLNGGAYAEFSGEWALTEQWSTELSVGSGSSLGLSDGNSIRLWPLTWTAKYEIAAVSYFHPYLGAGAHYTRSSLDTAINAVRDGIGSSSVGWVVQGGVDARFAPNWSANLDLRYLGNLEPRNRLNGLGYPGGSVYRIDPLLIGIGVAYRWQWSH